MNCLQVLLSNPTCAATPRPPPSAAMQLVSALLGVPPPHQEPKVKVKATANKKAAGAPLKVKVDRVNGQDDDKKTAETREKAAEAAAAEKEAWRRALAEGTAVGPCRLSVSNPS